MCKSTFITLVIVMSSLTNNSGFSFVSADNIGDFLKKFTSSNSIFSTVLSTYQDFVRNLGKTINAAIEEDCVYKCPNGMKPRPNRYHIPEGNGCGVPGLQIPKYMPISQLEKCCDNHDICYGTCNEKQQMCDFKFKECLYKICSSFEEYLSGDFLKGCKFVAKTMYTAVTAMGCKYYLDAQEEACVCYESSYDEF